MKYIFIAKELLVEEYSKNRKSERQLAEELDCSKATIARRLREYNIYIRSNSKSHRIKYDFITKDFIEKEYTTKSICRIARKVGCSSWVIANKMEKFHIPKRTQSEAIKLIYGKGKKGNNYNLERHKKHYCIELNCNNEISYVNWLSGSKRCNSCANRGAKRPQMSKRMKALWQNKKFRENRLEAFVKGNYIKPNKPEKQLNKLLQKVLPNEYRINVKANVMTLGRKIPDFVNTNGQKKVIELFGDYWHSKRVTGRAKEQEEQRRIGYFKNLGYQTLIIWQHELGNLDKVRTKIETFNAV